MGMFELHPTHQVRNFVERAEGRGPIGDGQASIIAGHQGPGNDQKECRTRGADREVVERGVVWFPDSLQKALLGSVRAAEACLARPASGDAGQAPAPYEGSAAEPTKAATV